MSAAISPSPVPRSGAAAVVEAPAPAVPASAPPFRAPPEAFGQTGIRQYLGSFVALASAALMAVSLAMWFRSQGTADVIDIYHPYGRTMLSSTWGRLRVASIPAQAEQEWTWYYTSRPFTYRGTDPWQPSIWKTLGIEARVQPVDGTVNGGGWWLRVRWSTAAALTGIWPLLHAVRQTRQSKQARQRRDADDVERYCGRCGRETDRASPACHHCGRRLA